MNSYGSRAQRWLFYFFKQQRHRSGNTSVMTETALRNLLVRDRSRAPCNGELYLICATHLAPVHVHGPWNILECSPNIRRAISIFPFQYSATAIEFPFLGYNELQFVLPTWEFICVVACDCTILKTLACNFQLCLLI